MYVIEARIQTIEKQMFGNLLEKTLNNKCIDCRYSRQTAKFFFISISYFN